jgi:hypothetical protein
MKPWLGRGRFRQRRTIRRNTKVLLASLGGNAEVIARHLTKVGVRGVPQNAFDCALSRYLSAVIPTVAGIEEIAVGRVGKKPGPSQLILRLTDFPRWTVRIDLAEEFQEFLSEFDAHRYPDLVVSPDRAVVRRGPSPMAP